MPKNKRLLKLLNETGVKQMVQRMELDAIADRKLPIRQQRMRDVEDVLYFVLDEKGHSVHLTDRGRRGDVARRSGAVPGARHLGGDPPDRQGPRAHARTTGSSARREVEAEYALKSEKLHIIHKLLQAHVLYEKDVDYLVQEGQVVIVDEFTGRVMSGRRWADGLHQAVEAKEGVQVKGETQTFATITIQNYFRMYDKLAGMTGTAETEETEFYQHLRARGQRHPHQPAGRAASTRWTGSTRPGGRSTTRSLDEVERLHELGWPVLIGTVNVDVSETLSRQLKRRGLKHEVLNAKYHQREAEIVAGAGQRARSRSRPTWPAAAPTSNWARISTSPWKRRASRSSAPSGTSRAGSTASCAAGRAARAIRAQSIFFLSLEDDLMRLFGSDRIARLDGQERGGGGRGHHRRTGHPGHRAGAEAGRAAELPAAEAAARVRRRDEPAARGDLLAAALRAGAGRGAQGRGAPDDRGRARAGGRLSSWRAPSGRRSTTAAGCARRSRMQYLVSPDDGHRRRDARPTLERASSRR